MGKNYLKEVVIRIDMPRKFEFADGEFPKKLEKTILTLFPILEPLKGKGYELQIRHKENTCRTIEKETKQWNFYDKNKIKKLSFTELSVDISYKQYESFGILKNDFFTVLKQLFEIYPDLQITRLGLRYINEIELGPNQRQWRTIIKKELLENFKLDLKNKSRVFSVIDITEEDMKIRFQYGVPNPDFPASIKKNLFILDYDVFYQGLLNEKQIVDKTVQFHGKIKELHNQFLLKK